MRRRTRGTDTLRQSGSRRAHDDKRSICRDALQGRARFLIGSASQLVSVTAEAAEIELVELGTTELIRRKTLDQSVRTPVGLTVEEAAQLDQFDEFDY